MARTVRLLAAVADAGRPVRVGELAATLDLAPSTVHRLLRLLSDEGVIAAAPHGHRYVAGPEMYRLSALVVASVDLTARARPHLHDLARRFDETVLFGMHLDGQSAMAFTARADGGQVLQYRIDLHRPLSLVWGASGKAILAHLSPEEVELALARESTTSATGAPPPAPDDLAAELHAIRQRGYASSEAEKLPDARGIGAPVFGPQGVVGCLLLTSPRARLPHENIRTIGEAIVRRASQLSDELTAGGA